MAEVSGIGGAEFSVAKGGFPPDENGRLNRPAREEARPEDSDTSPVRSNEAQADQRTTQPSQTTNDGDARQNAANTGGFTAGGTDRREDTVLISPEAQNAARAEANAARPRRRRRADRRSRRSRRSRAARPAQATPWHARPKPTSQALRRLRLRRPGLRSTRPRRPKRPDRPRPTRRTRGSATRIRTQRSTAAKPASPNRAAPSARSSTSSLRLTEPSMR